MMINPLVSMDTQSDNQWIIQVDPSGIVVPLGGKGYPPFFRHSRLPKNHVSADFQSLKNGRLCQGAAKAKAVRAATWKRFCTYIFECNNLH